MDLPSTSDLQLDPSVSIERTSAHRLVLWVSGSGETDWLRLASLTGTSPECVGSFVMLAADSLPMRAAPKRPRFAFWRPAGADDSDTWKTPTGLRVEPTAARTKGLAFIWSRDRGSLSEAEVAEAFSDARVERRLGHNLLLVAINETIVAAPSVAKEDGFSPVEQATKELDSARRRGDATHVLQAMIDLGAALVRSGDAGRGVEFLRQAIDAATSQGDLLRGRDAAANLGAAYLDLRQGDEAVAILQSVLSNARLAEDRYTEKMMLSQLGTAWSLAMEPQRALTYFEPAQQIAEDLGDRADEADLLWRSAICRDELGDRKGAWADAERSIALLRDLGSPLAEEYESRWKQHQANPSSLGISETQGPSPMRMAMSAASSFMRFAGSGFRRVDAATREGRLSICNGCSHHTGVRCRACGCFTSQKTWLPHERCPLGKWEPAPRR